MKLKTLIVDDEYNCRKNLEILIEEYCPEISIEGVASNVDEALALAEELQPQVIFLDIHMPGKDGFSFLEAYKGKEFSVIFTTAHNEYALEAFKADALDYLEKPIDIEALEKAVQKLVRMHKGESPLNSSEDLLALLGKHMQQDDSHKIAIPTKDGYELAEVQEIIHLEAKENYTMIYLTNDRKFLSSKTIKLFEMNLNDTIFFRAHKSHILNVKHHVKSFNKTEGNIVVLTNGKEVPVSRRKLTEFLDRLNTI